MEANGGTAGIGIGIGIGKGMMQGKTEDEDEDDDDDDDDDGSDSDLTEDDEEGGHRKGHAGGKAHRNASRRFVLLSLPPVVIVHAQRFRLQAMGATARYVKDDKQLGFPLRIDFRPWMLRDSPVETAGASSPNEERAHGALHAGACADPGAATLTTEGDSGAGKLIQGIVAQTQSPVKAHPTEYELFGVVCHHGATLSGGHYTAYVKAGAGWRHASDASVSAATEQQVLASQAYLLFYRRLDAKAS